LRTRQKKLIVFIKGDVVCLLGGTNCIFKFSSEWVQSSELRKSHFPFSNIPTIKSVTYCQAYPHHIDERSLTENLEEL